MPFHLPFQIPKLPDFLKRPLDPTQTLEAFEHYAEKAIDAATRHGGEIGRNIMDDLVDLATPYASALDIGVDALLPGINLWYGEKWAQGLGKRNPFKQKGGVIKPKTPQSPAHMPERRNFGPKRKRKAPIEAQLNTTYLRTPKRRRKMPGKFVSGVIRRPRKQKRARKPVRPTMSTKRHYEDHGTVDRDHTLWLKFNTHGTIRRIYDIAGEALARAVLAKMGVKISHYDQQIFEGATEPLSLQITYRNINQNGADSELTHTVLIGSKTFKTFSTDVSDSVEDFADAVFGTRGGGYYPAEFRVLSDNTAGAGTLYGFQVQDKCLDQAILSINCRSAIKLQNITSNADGNSKLDVTGTNPIKGKRYHFNDGVAKLVGQLHDQDAEYHEFERQGGNSVTSLGQLASEDLLAHPPTAKTVWTNCRGVAPVYMAAGAGSAFAESFQFKGTFRRFVETVYLSGTIKRPFGKCVWYCFERAYKQNGTTADADHIAVGFNRGLTMYAHCKLKRVVPMLKHYDNDDLGAL